MHLTKTKNKSKHYLDALEIHIQSSFFTIEQQIKVCIKQIWLKNR